MAPKPVRRQVSRLVFVGNFIVYPSRWHPPETSMGSGPGNPITAECEAEDVTDYR